MKIALSETQVDQLVRENKYPIKESEWGYVNTEIILLTGENYGFEVDKEKTEEIIKKSVKGENAFDNKNLEGTVLFIEGPYYVSSKLTLKVEGIEKTVTIFVYHRTIANAQMKSLAKKLIQSEAVKLYEGCDEEYLYEVLTNTFETYLFDFIKMKAKVLPIYEVKFSEDASYKLEKLVS